MFLPRHGRGPKTPPTDVNFRANIDALKRASAGSISLSGGGEMKRRSLIKAGAAATAVAVAGFLFAWSGLFNIGASTGHWAITAWFLHFAMRNSVETHAMGIEAPALDDPALVLKGAGHYAHGCAPCHGTPGRAANPVVREMTPQPPHLVGQIEHWAPEELFWIVKHGVKFTAMPAWPARDRDDEVWAMTAFLLRLRELSPAEYHVLREAGTERPGSSPLEAPDEQPYTYSCRACGAELFRSATKFDSHCGWPSFWSPLAGDRVILREDRSLGAVRVEVLCATCDSHLGHVFSGEGYGTPTDDRYCINSISLTFEEEPAS